MKRIFALSLASAVVALPACGGGNEDKGGGNTATAASKSGGDETASAGTNSWIVGRWGEGGNCTDTIEFMSDGRAVIEGDQATWSLSGQTLTLTADGESETATAQQTGDNQLSLILGSRTETFTRC